jgi:hypothetical protein
MDQLS